MPHSELHARKLYNFYCVWVVVLFETLFVIQVIHIPCFSFLGKERLPLNQLSTIEKAMFSCYPNPLAMVEGSGLGT